MSLTPASRVGPYEIVAPLGQGGMGEVYLARDTRLGREVAIKALPDAFAHDPERLARFEREARVLASLKHPNIAAIHGLEEMNGQRYLVLEYVPGATLAERLSGGALPLDETLELCGQIAAGVEAAHESGVVHRDLKPANVKITPAGEVKVLDFGLAKGGGSTSSSGLDLSNSPTIAHATSVGVILGTAAYMSPEQARGRTVDRRTDIWSFGCVLYECLTGKPLYEGETVSDLIAHILTREPDWSALPAGTSPRLRELLARCLRKDPRERQRDIGDVRIELGEIRAGKGGETAPAAARSTTRPVSSRERMIWLTALVALTITGALLAPRLTPKPHAAHVRFTLGPPPGNELAVDYLSGIVSPDGNHLAIMAVDTTGTRRIWLREFDGLATRPVAGTENAIEMFWSPDSRHIGFFADGKLCRIPIQGGTRTVLADARDSRGGTWSSRGTIVFAPNPSGPLMKIPAEGGEVTVAVGIDTTAHETAQRYPAFLPDGDHFTFVILPRRAGGEHDVVLASLSSPRRRVLFSSSTSPAPVPGALLYTHAGQLSGIRCDAHGGLSGKPFVLGPGPQNNGPTGAPSVSASQTGILVYWPPPGETRVQWFNASGAVTGTVPVPAGRYERIDFSPDGRQGLMLRGTDPYNRDLVRVDLATGASTRLVPSSEFGGLDNALWSPDGSRIVFSSLQRGPSDLYLMRAEDSARPELLYGSPLPFKNATSWSPDGRAVCFSQPDPKTGWDVLEIPVDGDRKVVPLLHSSFNETGGWYSPDGRWLAFVSDESGRSEAYIAPLPSCSPRVQVSTAGAIACLWRSDGRALVIYNNDLTVRIVDVDPGPPLRVGRAQSRLRLPSTTVWAVLMRDFQRGLVSVPVDDALQATVTVETGWQIP